MNLVERFWKKANRPDSDACWVWTACVDDWGYGRFVIDGVVRRAHRVSWVFEHGEIPADMLVLHQCDNPPCVNPTHLFLGTHLDNKQDMISKGRKADASGEKNGRAQLSEADVLEIRRLRGELNQPKIAECFGVSTSTVCHIQTDRIWKHLLLEVR